MRVKSSGEAQQPVLFFCRVQTAFPLHLLSDPSKQKDKEKILFAFQCIFNHRSIYPSLLTWSQNVPHPSNTHCFLVLPRPRSTANTPGCMVLHYTYCTTCFHIQSYEHVKHDISCCCWLRRSIFFLAKSYWFDSYFSRIILLSFFFFSLIRR